MKRRSFMGSLAALACGVVGCKCSASLKAEKPDPYEFIQVYTYKNSFVTHGKFKFYQSDNNICITEYQDNVIPHGLLTGAKGSITVPIDFKVNQKSKDDFIAELKKYSCGWHIFELIADNGKSNTYAQAINWQSKNKAWGV